jgi:flagellar hook-associated protein 3 FlgL
MRVTDGSITTRVLANLQRNAARSSELQEKLSSGKQINRPSDSPSGTITSMQLRGEVRSFEQYSRSAEDGLGWLGQVDSALQDSMTQTTVARNLVVQGLNLGSMTPASREAVAVQVDAIRESLIGVSNVKYLDRPVFGGTTAGGVAYDSAGVWQGDSGQVWRTVGKPIQPPPTPPAVDNAKIRVDTGGPEAFGTGTTQLFTVLQDISASLRANDMTALSGDLANLDTAGDLLKSKLSDVGARYNRVTQMRESAENRLVTLKSQLSDVEDVDLPQTIMEMKLQETAYQAALATAAKVIQPSLLDYLR